MIAQHYFCRFPFVCVSIGLTIGKVPAVGVVYNPILDEVRICAPSMYYKWFAITGVLLLLKAENYTWP